MEPNDCQCHLDESGTYSHSLLQDYPSLSQINRQARDNNIHVIFAVPKSKNETYQMLSRGISGSAVGIIEKHDRSAVIELIQDEYKVIYWIIDTSILWAIIAFNCILIIIRIRNYNRLNFNNFVRFLGPFGPNSRTFNCSGN